MSRENWPILECTIYSEMIIDGTLDEEDLRRMFTEYEQDDCYILEWLEHWKKLSEEKKKEEAKEWRRKLNESYKENETKIQSLALKYKAFDPNFNVDEHLNNVLKTVEVLKKDEKYLIAMLETGKIKEAIFREFLIEKEIPKVLVWLDDWKEKNPEQITLEALQAQHDYHEKHKKRQERWNDEIHMFKIDILNERYKVFQLVEPHVMNYISDCLFYQMDSHLQFCSKYY